MIKIDTDEMQNGSQVADQLRKGREGGIPWMVILDPTGNELISSDGPDGNIGCPVRPSEIDYFLTMIENTSPASDTDSVVAIRMALEEFAKSYQ